MPLSPGTSLGPYEILSSLGAGGMGEVYRARDTKLGREVAIKVLPDALASNPELLTRFEREAKMLAALNHPNIAAIYGIEEHALVMELVEGETLASLCKNGPLPVEDALKIAGQIAAGLEAAHEHGIIHRDLKPANVVVTPAGVVKLLDFGLAKAAEEPMSGFKAGSSNSPTLTISPTRMGMIMGTAAYMSPEQASGKPVDKRADIWSFGVVLWEMLAHKKLFDGETVSHTLADVLRSPVEFSGLPKEIPSPIRDLLRRCLDRNVNDRLRDIGEARFVIGKYLSNPKGEVESPSPGQANPPAAARLPWAVAAVFLVTALALGFVHFRESSPIAEPVRVNITPPEGTTLLTRVSQIAVSPDGSRLAFVAVDNAGKVFLWVRPLSSLSAQRLEGTEGAANPFWSPDSQSVAFFAETKLKRVQISGGPAQTISDVNMGAEAGARGGTWSKDGTILFATARNGSLQSVAATGGVPSPVTTLDKAKEEIAHVYPQFLPDGKQFLYLAKSSDAQKSGVYVQTLGSSERQLLLTTETAAAFAPPERLLFLRDGTLLAQDLDLRSLRLQGEPVAVAEGVGQNLGFGSADFSISQNGVLAYRGGGVGTKVQLARYTRDGKRLDTFLDPGAYWQIELSPDDQRLAVERTDEKTGTINLWLLEMASGVFSRLTFGSGDDRDPLWSADSRRVVFEVTPTGRLYEVVVGSGGEKLIYEDGKDNRLDDWSPDGRLLVYHMLGSLEFFGLPLEGERKPQLLFQTPFRKDEMRISPDGRWIAYDSSESGRSEVYIAAFPGFTERRQISNNGGVEPRWRRDSRELFYLAADGKLMALEVRPGATLQTGLPKMLFQTATSANANVHYYAVTGDGQRVLVREPVGNAAVDSISLVINWPAAMKK